MPTDIKYYQEFGGEKVSYVCVCVRACVRACVCVCVCACVGRRVGVSGTCLKLIHVAFPAQVIFEKEEVDSLKSFAEPGLLLLGFKPKERLKPHYYTKPANFIYPDESVSSPYLIQWKQYRAPTTCTLARLHTTYLHR